MRTTKRKMKKRNTNLPCHFLHLIFILIIVWGCAVSPPKLNIKGMPDAFDEGTIIATQEAAAVFF